MTSIEAAVKASDYLRTLKVKEVVFEPPSGFFLVNFTNDNEIYLTADYFATEEDWNKIVKDKGISKKYKLTKVETTWKYK